MSLFSRRRITLTLESGEFDCPACASPEVFWHRSIRRFLAVGRVPLIPLAKAGEYVECQQCGHRYAIEILGDDPGPRYAEERVEFARHVAWVMVLAAVESGPMNNAQIGVIGDVYSKLAGGMDLPDGIRGGFELAIRSKIHPSDYVRRFIEVFREPGRIKIVRQAVENVMRAGDHEAEAIAASLVSLHSAIAIGEAAPA